METVGNLNALCPARIVLPPIGLYEKALPARFDWQQRLAAARATGFDFVEMSIDESDARLARLDWSRQERRDFRCVVEDSGIAVPSVCLSAHRRFPFGSADPDVRARARDVMSKAIQLACDIGVRTLQLAGYDVYYEPSTPDSLQRFEDGLAWANERAAQAQVMLAMEIMDTPLIGSISKWLHLANSIRGPWFQVYPDLGNLSAWGNDVPAELAKGLAHIVAIHLKDTLAVRPGFPGQFRDVPFGTGCVDFVAAFAALNRLGYHGCYLIEMWSGESEDPIAAVSTARTWVIERIIEGGRLA